ncbi:TD and POZ domain-containing protein 3-like [Stegodyphus dumicola]|uniref:TD and POZ domain-containing protein 3-like n=1 Tax=Stegodyphus dumicola TaxID=202533 RepID=UPI0015B2258E|nr:TD and POZ domain-containing protein 3-like [Stegodyphus dumicola]XP_035207540.1 TD and POZ domain-containing protein 3-like [Stegodyphus dumicola]
MEEEPDDTFTFTWIIENFSMCYHPKRKYICSPKFAMHTLPGVEWNIKLYPQGTSDENYTDVYLVKDNTPEDIFIYCTIEMLDSNEKSIFRHTDVTAAYQTIVYCRKERKSLLESLINDNLLIRVSFLTRCGLWDSEILPSLCHKNVFEDRFADVVLRAGDAIFKVHKALLWARWPKVVEKMEAEQTSHRDLDMQSDVLEAIIGYLYTGKINFKESELLAADISSAASEYEISTLNSTPVVAQKARTFVNAEKISFEWPIANFSRLPVGTLLRSRLFTVRNLASCGWNLILNIYESPSSVRVFGVSICKTYEREFKPIFVTTKIRCNWFNYFETSKLTLYENSHLFLSDKIWKCADISKNVCPNSKDRLILTCEFKFSNCSRSTEIVESFCEFVPTVNCHYFSNDFLKLYKSGKFSDVSIIAGWKIFSTHKFILSARSSVFRRMLEAEMIESRNGVIEISDIDPDVVDKMLSFLYTGKLEPPLKETIMQKLYSAADKYDIPALLKIGSSFLKSNLTVKGVCEVLHLAHLHSDKDLYKTALAYFNAHSKEVFATDEWKNMSKENFWMKVLENSVVEF